MTNDNLHDPSAPPFQFDPRVGLHATGTWKRGGTVEVRFGRKTIATFRLSTTDWGVLALLIKAGRRSAKDHWARGFLPADELAAQLKATVHRGNGLTDDAYRSIHRLRKSLKERLGGLWNFLLPPDGDTNGNAADRPLIELHPAFGYRISLPPERLGVLILEEEATET